MNRDGVETGRGYSRPTEYIPAPKSPQPVNSGAIFQAVDSSRGDSQIEVWTNGSGDLHVLIESDTGSESIYIRKGLELGKAIVRELWL